MELLAVISIISVLTTMAVPALVSSQRASALTHAGNQLADLASLARQTAMSKNAITALIVSTKPPGSQTVRQAALVMQYDGVANAWAPLGGWVRLSESVIAADNFTDNTAVTRLALPDLRVDGAPLSPSGYTALVFYPDGHMVNGTSSRELAVSPIAGNTQANYYKLVFNSDTSAYHITRP